MVAVADTHLYHRELTVPDGDVFVHCGDLCQGGTLDELEDGLAWLHSLPHETKILVAGNHDWAFVEHRAEALRRLGNIVYLEDAEYTIHGARFWGSPWQPAYNDWAFNLPRGPALRAKWDLIPAGIDVLVTHGPPEGVGDRGPSAGRHGCEELAERVKALRPPLHLFGHIHQDGGLWELDGVAYVNATTWECERPPTVLDFVEGRVIPVHVPPARRT
jgi:predicted phosphohydrolase